MKRLSKVVLKQGKFLFEKESDYNSLNSKGFGHRNGESMFLMSYEALYLLELRKIEVIFRGEILSFIDLKLRREINLDLFLVYKDLRSKGYYLGSGLKFGCDFRVYDKGHGKDESHAKWLVKIFKGSKKISLNDFSSNIRVAHSTKKKLLTAVIDSENSVTYYESEWLNL